MAKGWRFEVNMEQVKKSDTWLRARTGFVRAHLLLLWSESWEQTPCGSLPDDDELLALILDMEPEVFSKHRAVLMRGWWLASDGRLYHDTVAARVLAMMQKRAKDAARTARNRAKTAEHESGSADVTRDTQVTPAEVMGEFATKHQAPDKKKPTASSADADAEKTPDPQGFPEFWTAWPGSARKQDRKKCAAKWRRCNFGREVERIVAHVEASKSTRSWRDGFEPAPLTYLNGERWRDGPPADVPAFALAGDV
jgi:hypothetical protein